MSQHKDDRESTLRRERQDLGTMSFILLLVGAISVNLGLGYDNLYGGLFGGLIMITGAVFGILWAVHD